MWKLPGKNNFCEENIKFFTETFRAAPSVVACAPGRVNLIGEHTDYQEGFVFPAALDRRTVIALTLNGSGTYTIVSAERGRYSSSTAATKPSTESHWYNYVLGAIACFCEEAGINYPKGFNITVKTTVPLESGLSSSAALEVATATAMEAATGKVLPPLVKARDVCQRCEHQWAHVPCGLMDQAIAVMAHHGAAMMFDCKTQVAQHAPLDSSLALIVVHSGVKHFLVSGEYAARRECCEAAVKCIKTVDPSIHSLRDVTPELLERAKSTLQPTEYKRAYHVVNENNRALRFFAALRKGDLHEAGSIMYAGHWSLKDNFDVTVPETDAIVTIAKDIDGVYGARMTGGGFGGSVVVLVDATKAPKIEAELSTKYTEAFKKLSTVDTNSENVERTTPTVFVAKPSCGAFVYFPK